MASQPGRLGGGRSSSSSNRSKVPASIANGRFKIGNKLGAGCFGEVYSGTNLETKREVAVKFEDKGVTAPQLEQEAEVLKQLGRPIRPQGVVELLHFGAEGQHYCLAMDRLGKSLEDRVRACHGILKPLTVALVSEQVLCRIEYLHSKGIVHRDIKPENFMWGMGERQHHLYLIDFGLSKRYYDFKHSSMRSHLSLTGTARYASISAHKGLEQSRRDDLEAIGHMLIYFLRGVLPWSGLEAKNKQEKYNKIREKKETVPLAELCKGFPAAFEVYLRYSRELAFKDRPNYNYCRGLFREVRTELSKARGHNLQDHDFEWNDSKALDPATLEPLIPLGKIQQPDDPPENGSVVRRSLCCLCGVKGQVDD